MTAPHDVPDLTGSGEYLVPDVLQPGLTLVLVGTAPSGISARARAYYANPENKFWRTLHAVGLTPRQLVPQEYATLPQYGLGLTDVAKRHSGVDAALPGEAWRPDELRRKVEHYRPRIVAFTSKRGASETLGVPTGKLPYGPQPQRKPSCGCCPRRVRWATTTSGWSPGRRSVTGCANCAGPPRPGTHPRKPPYCRRWLHDRPHRPPTLATPRFLP